MLHDITSDGITVWVNGAEGLLARFGRAGIDIHRPLTQQYEKGECLFCTHEMVTAADWPLFVSKVQECFGITVSNDFMPERFR